MSQSGGDVTRRERAFLELAAWHVQHAVSASPRYFESLHPQPVQTPGSDGSNGRPLSGGQQRITAGALRARSLDRAVDTTADDRHAAQRAGETDEEIAHVTGPTVPMIRAVLRTPL